MLFGKYAVIALGVFSFNCFLSTAATPFTACTSWCLQKALEMSRGALKRVLLLCSVTQKCHVGEERSGPGDCMVAKAHELLCHTAVPRCQGLLPAAAAVEHPSGGEGRRKPLLFSASSFL